MIKAKSSSLENAGLDLAERATTLVSSQAVRTMFDLGEEAQASAGKIVQSELVIELSLSTALVSSTAWFAQALYLNRSNKRFFPPDWLEQTCTTNADVAMACILCQFANYSHAIIELVCKGLDTPARALLRTTADLSYMLVILSTNREKFQSYVLDNTSSPKEHWYKLFSNRKLTQSLTQINQTLGLSEQWSKSMQTFREKNSEFFSEAIHHSKNSILIGAQPTIRGTDQVAFALLGGPPSGSGATLSHLTDVLNYGLTSFVCSSSQRPEYEPTFAYPECWQTGISIYNTAQPLYLEWLKKCND